MNIMELGAAVRASHRQVPGGPAQPDDPGGLGGGRGAAADGATRAIDRFGIEDERTWLAVATAKIRAGEAAGAGAAIAHQAHGAMGFAREYSLDHVTRRLWAWRYEFGAETAWAAELGRRVAAGGADAFWPTLTARLHCGCAAG